MSSAIPSISDYTETEHSTNGFENTQNGELPKALEKSLQDEQFEPPVSCTVITRNERTGKEYNGFGFVNLPSHLLEGRPYLTEHLTPKQREQLKKYLAGGNTLFVHINDVEGIRNHLGEDRIVPQEIAYHEERNNFYIKSALSEKFLKSKFNEELSNLINPERLSRDEMQDMSSRLPTAIYNAYGPEAALAALGKTPEKDIFMTDSGMVYIPETQTIVIPNDAPARDYERHVWMIKSSKQLAEDVYVTGSGIRLNLAEQEPAHLIEYDDTSQLTVGNLLPDSKLNTMINFENPENSNPSAVKKAKALVYAALAQSRPALRVIESEPDENGEIKRYTTKEPIQSFTLFGSKAKVHITYDTDGKMHLMSNGEELTDLPTTDIVRLFEMYYPGGPTEGNTISGIQALETGVESIQVEATMLTPDNEDAVYDQLAEMIPEGMNAYEYYLNRLDKKGNTVERLLNQRLVRDYAGLRFDIDADLVELEQSGIRPVLLSPEFVVMEISYHKEENKFGQKRLVPQTETMVFQLRDNEWTILNDDPTYRDELDIISQRNDETGASTDLE